MNQVQDITAKYILSAAAPVDNDRVLTYDGPYEHPLYGLCVARIYRAVRNDNGVAYEATVRALKAGEPYDIGFWPGDHIQYLSEDGYLLEVIE